MYISTSTHSQFHDSETEWGLKKEDASLDSKIVNNICYHSHSESGGGLKEPDSPGVDSHNQMEESEDTHWK